MVTEGGPNNLDIHGVGTNRPGYETSWNCYDRLIIHETRTLPDGTLSYDRDKFKPELAEDMKVGDMSATFKLKKNVKFHDGAPVTARDVKWSLDRPVTVGGFPAVQMKAGSLVDKEQLVVVVDDSTVRIDFTRKDIDVLHGLDDAAPGGEFNGERRRSAASRPMPPRGCRCARASRWCFRIRPTVSIRDLRQRVRSPTRSSSSAAQGARCAASPMRGVGRSGGSGWRRHRPRHRTAAKAHDP